MTRQDTTTEAGLLGEVARNQALEWQNHIHDMELDRRPELASMAKAISTMLRAFYEAA